MSQPEQKNRHTTPMGDEQFYNLLRLTINGAQADGMSQQELAACLQPLIFPETLDVKPHAAARMLGLSVSTLETYRYRRTGPDYFHDDSGRVFYPWAALVEYRQHQRHRSMQTCRNPTKTEQYAQMAATNTKARAAA